MVATALDLQKAVHAVLAADAALTAALGGARVFDYVPAETPFPYVLFGAAAMRDWSSDHEDGAELTFTLHVWSRARGKAETLALMDLARKALDDTPPEPAHGRLVLMRLERAEAAYQDDLSAYRGTMRFRALVEG
jgi:hypothetical protein